MSRKGWRSEYWLFASASALSAEIECWEYGMAERAGE